MTDQKWQDPLMELLAKNRQACGVHEICMAGDRWLKLMFFKKLNYNIIKIAKTMRIFMELEHIESWGVIF